MTKLAKWFDSWIEAFRISPEGLALFRICFAGGFLLFFVKQYVWINQFPQGFFHPPAASPGVLLGGFPSYGVLLALSLAGCVLLIALMFGYRTRVVSILLAVVWILGDNLNYSFGKIDHAIMFPLVPLVMAFSSWGAHYSIDAYRRGSSEIRERGSWTVAAVACLLGAGFLTAGFPKLLGWIDFDLATQGVRGWLYQGYHITGREDYLASFFMGIENPYFWEALDIAAVVFEVGCFVALLWPPIFKVFVFFAVFFHLSNYLMLNIAFTNLMWTYMLFISWDKVKHKVRDIGLADWLKRTTTTKYLLIFSLLYIPIYLLALHIPDPLPMRGVSPLSLFVEQVLGMDYSPVRTWAIYAIAVTVAMLHLGYFVRDSVRSRRREPNKTPPDQDLQPKPAGETVENVVSG